MPKMVGNCFFPIIVALTGKIKLCKVVRLVLSCCTFAGFYLILSVESQGVTSRPTNNTYNIERIFHPNHWEEDDHHDHQEHDHHQEDEHHDEDDLEPGRSVDVQTWLHASVAVVLISLCGIFGVLIIPIMQKMFYQHLLQFLIALGKVSQLLSCSLRISF